MLNEKMASVAASFALALARMSALGFKQLLICPAGKVTPWLAAAAVCSPSGTATPLSSQKGFTATFYDRDMKRDHCTLCLSGISFGSARKYIPSRCWLLRHPCTDSSQHGSGPI